MKNIDKNIVEAINHITEEDGYPEVSKMVISLVNKLSADSIDQESIDLIIHNLMEELG